MAFLWLMFTFAYMMPLSYSFIIPVYNRPNEVEELLHSFSELNGNYDYEIVIVEDGSELTAEDITKQFSNTLNISYYYKSNSGPGASRNYGIQKAKGNYFIILDSMLFCLQITCKRSMTF